MNHLFPASLKRLLPPGLALLAATVFFAPSTAHATAYVVKLVQQGSNVVATGSGAIDLSSLSSYGPNTAISAIGPSIGFVGTGPGGVHVDLVGYDALFTGPGAFGSGGVSVATTGTGVQVDAGFTASGPPNGGVLFLFVSPSYVSGDAITSGATWDNATFASLGVTPGTYVWKWGTAADQSFTLMIGGGTASVPEPAELGMFGLGLLVLGGFTTLRRREPPQIG